MKYFLKVLKTEGVRKQKKKMFKKEIRKSNKKQTKTVTSGFLTCCFHLCFN